MGHTHRCQLAFKKKKKSGQESQSQSHVLETGSDPPIGSGRDSGRDKVGGNLWMEDLELRPWLRKNITTRCGSMLSLGMGLPRKITG